MNGASGTTCTSPRDLPAIFKSKCDQRGTLRGTLFSPTPLTRRSSAQRSIPDCGIGKFLASKRWKEARSFLLIFPLHAYHGCLVRCRFVGRAYLDSTVSISKVGRRLMVGGGHRTCEE